MYRVTIRQKALITSIVLSMGTSALVGLLTRDSFTLHEQLYLPPLSPPPSVSPIA